MGVCVYVREAGKEEKVKKVFLKKLHQSCSYGLRRWGKRKVNRGR